MEAPEIRADTSRIAQDGRDAAHWLTEFRGLVADVSELQQQQHFFADESENADWALRSLAGAHAVGAAIYHVEQAATQLAEAMGQLNRVTRLVRTQCEAGAAVIKRAEASDPRLGHLANLVTEIIEIADMTY